MDQGQRCSKRISVVFMWLLQVQPKITYTFYIPPLVVFTMFALLPHPAMKP